MAVGVDDARSGFAVFHGCTSIPLSAELFAWARDFCQRNDG